MHKGTMRPSFTTASGRVGNEPRGLVRQMRRAVGTINAWPLRARPDRARAPTASDYYVVSATNSAGESGNSSEVSATVTPVAPWNLMAVASNGQITLSWTACAWATNYNVKRSTSSGTETTITTSTTLTYADTNVVNGTKYYYVVSGLDATGEGGNSSEVSATPGGLWRPDKLMTSGQLN
jgi:hypothetical protein